MQKQWLLCAFILLAFVVLAVVRINAESYDFGAYYADEYHTVHEGLDFIAHGTVANFRAQESVRWLVRIFYPYALLTMNTHMGGNVQIDGWEYPGHDYVIAHFIDAAQNADFSLDPNLRLLFHALRVEYIIFVFACVLALLLFFWRKGYRIAAFGTLLLLGLSVDLVAEQKIFYLEPGMLASLALFILAFSVALYRAQVSTRMMIILGFLAAFMLATKFSTLFFVLLPLVLLLYRERWQARFEQTAWYVGSVIVSYLFINFPAFLSLASFNRYLHDLSSNFWQYAAGSDAGSTVTPGLMHLGLLAYQLEGFFGYALYALPLIMLFGFWHADKRERMLIGPLLLVSLMSVWSLSRQFVYMPRNLVPFYLPLALAAVLCLEIFARQRVAVGRARQATLGIAILCVLWLAGIAVHAGGIRAFASDIAPNAKAGFIARVETEVAPGHSGPWISIDFPKNFFESSTLPSSTAEPGAPAALSNKNYPAFEARFSSLASSTVVMVHAAGNDKHLVNYVLPKYFNRNIQVGDYFAFYNVQ